jgi:predicted acyl esterase
MFGLSYDGLLVVLATLHPHPALKAVSEQASPVDMFLNDDFHHNGAFRLSYGFEYAALLETSGAANTHFAFDLYDTYEWYLRLGALSNANALYFHNKMPTWNGFIEHPNYDAYWQRQSLIQYFVTPSVPDLNVDGWWDQEDMWGPQEIFSTYSRNDPQRLEYFVAGPWNHGSWVSGEHTRAVVSLLASRRKNARVGARNRLSNRQQSVAIVRRVAADEGRRARAPLSAARSRVIIQRAAGFGRGRV